MKAWWRNLSLSKKLHLPIQLSLFIVLPLAQFWGMGRFEENMLEDVRQHAEGSATQSFLGLNAMMLNGSISDPHAREIFFRKMSRREGVESFRVVRGEALRRQFGDGMEAERQADALDRAALSENAIQVESSDEGKRVLRVVVPFAAGRDVHGTDCLQCHQVPEGTVLGAVSLTVDLESEYDRLGRLSRALIAGQIALQLLLFLLIGWIIRRVTGSVSELERTMLEVHASADFSRRARVRGTDEIGHIAQAFNGFVAQIEELYRQLAEKVAALERYHDRTEEELRIGSDIMARISQAYSTGDPAVRVKLSPAGHYSGDLILISRTPSNNLHILLADAVGHGLTAAMNLLPLGQAFNAMSRKGFAISRLAEELNSKIYRLMPVDRFVGAALISVDFRNRVIEVWNGGIPAPILVGEDGAVLHQWRSRNLPLGLLDESGFSAEVEVYHYDRDCQIFLFSDGLPEAESPAGEQFGMARIDALLQGRSPAERFDALSRALEAHLQGVGAHDDMSLAMVDISAENELDVLACHLHHPVSAEMDSRWKLSFSLGADELRYLDAVPLLTQIVGTIHATAEHHSALYVILSELFNNALDHGILGLDSSVKGGAEGFERYVSLRAEALRTLTAASLEIRIEKVAIDGKYAVKIGVRDSGEGFDHAALLAGQDDLPMLAQHGRGLALVRGLAHRVEFVGKGNEVVAYYICA